MTQTSFAQCTVSLARSLAELFSCPMKPEEENKQTFNKVGYKSRFHIFHNIRYFFSFSCFTSVFLNGVLCDFTTQKRHEIINGILAPVGHNRCSRRLFMLVSCRYCILYKLRVLRCLKAKIHIFSKAISPMIEI